MKKVTKLKLKEIVIAAAPQLPESVVFIAGMRGIKNGQREIEFVQSRTMAGRKASLLALLNEGDKRFNSGRTTMRVWLMISEKGFNNVFGAIEGFDFAKASAMCEDLAEDERVALLLQAETINVNGVMQPIKIVCKETIEVEELPKSIREQLENEDLSEEIKGRYILQTAEGDLIVDKSGNKVYRRYELSYGDDEDVLVADKQLLSDHAKKLAKVGTTSTASKAKNILADALVG